MFLSALSLFIGACPSFCSNSKNANYFKTAAGAAIGDVITSVIATCASAEVNVLEYLNAIQRNHETVKTNPGQWLPWNYPKSESA